MLTPTPVSDALCRSCILVAVITRAQKAGIITTDEMTNQNRIIINAQAAARFAFYDMTLAHPDPSFRLVPNTLIQSTLTEVRSWIGKVKGEISRLHEMAPKLATEIDRAYGIELQVRPVACASSYHTPEPMRTTLVKNYETQCARIWEGAMIDLVQRLDGTLGVFVDRMEAALARDKALAEGKKDRNGVFRDSTVDNLKSLLKLWPDLNVLKDEHLTRLGNDLAPLVAYDAEDLRRDPKLREAVTTEAKGTLAMIRGTL